MAILAGDALQTLGSEILASRPPGREWAERRSAACREIFDALGWAGMAGGQALDLKGPENDAHRIEDILQIHRMKTGRFLEAALQIGAIFAGAPAAGQGQNDKAQVLQVTRNVSARVAGQERRSDTCDG